MSNTKIKLAAGTNVGMIRTNNEDNYAVCSDLTSSNWTESQSSNYIEVGQYGSLLVVADGMGGNNAGEVASTIAVDTIKQEFQPERLGDVVSSDEKILKFMRDVVKVADLNILNRGRDDCSTRGMGTTVVMAWLIDNKAYLCWCGDSRCYVFNPAIGLTRLSKDHSLVQELIDNNELNPEYASDHPYSNVITRCLGDVETRAKPDTKIYQLNNDDILLLCSDGLSSLCNDDEIVDILKEHGDELATCKDKLINAALAAGGYDNVTVVIGAIQSDRPVEDLSKTRRTDRIGFMRRHGQALLLLALLIALCSVYIYWEGGYDQAYQGIAATLHGITLKAKSFFQ